MQQTIFNKTPLKRIRTKKVSKETIIQKPIEDRVKNLIYHAIIELVEDPDLFEVTFENINERLIFNIEIDREQRGRAIGRSWRNIQALRIISEAIAAKYGKRIYIEVLNEDDELEQVPRIELDQLR